MTRAAPDALRLAIRCDASRAIGTGHVMRCLTLADALRARGWEAVFLCRAHEGHLGDLITRRGHALRLLAAPQADAAAPADTLAHAAWLGVGWEQDARECRALLDDLRPDWLVVDHYALDERWETVQRPATGRLFAIDDLADRPHACDLLLDQNLNRDADAYDALVPAACSRMIGARYAMLRPEFAARRAQSLSRRATGELRHILVALGGVDQHNDTSRVLEKLEAEALSPACSVTVALGPTAPCQEAVRRSLARMTTPGLLRVGVDDMAGLMCAADLAIGGVGSSAWERCCLGLPTIMVTLAENQTGAAQALAARGAGALAGGGVRLLDRFQGAFAEMRIPKKLRAMSAAAAALADGGGVDLVIGKMAAKRETAGR